MPQGFRFQVSEYLVYAQGISEALGAGENLSEFQKVALTRAVNYAATKARTESNRRMREQISWAARYLDGKLDLTPAKGSVDNPEARIDVAFRPTSLARFVVGSKTPWKAGVRLHVGAASFASSLRMFIVPLKRGTADITEENRNLGLAIRLKKGETISGKYKTKSLGKGLYLLYGPSPAQVFYTVAEDIVPNVSEWMALEYERQMKLRTN